MTLLAWSRSSAHTRRITQLESLLQETQVRGARLAERVEALQRRVETGAAAPPEVKPITPDPAPRQVDLAVRAAPIPAYRAFPAMPAVLPPSPPPPGVELPPPTVVEPQPSSVETPPSPPVDTVSPPLPPPSPPLDPVSPPSPPPSPPPVRIPLAAQPPPPRRPPSVLLSASRPVPPSPPAGPSALESAFSAARSWLFGGNTLVRVGMLLVFLGLAFLLRYASERVVIPLELRYLVVAGTALVGLVLGWRLRERRRAFGLLMQGGAVAAMYLCTFAALKLHGQPLIPTGAGFALLVAVVVLSAVLAVAQDALSLAVAGALGGFATPVLVSTGGGSHVALFSYFLLLNTGILAIAWWKAWRPLNLVGFFGTFSIGLAWGLRSYDPALHYHSTQLFLAAFFVQFVTIALLFARRMLLADEDAPTTRDPAQWSQWLARSGQAADRSVDGTLLFGTPILAFGLQLAVVRHLPMGAAWSALALGFFYLLGAQGLWRLGVPRHRLLTEVFLALGVVFVSMAIPLGLDPTWTSAAWAVEGAGLYWIGHRQDRPIARTFALLLQVGAAVTWVAHLGPAEDTVLHGSVLGAVLLGAAFLADLVVLQRAGPRRTEAWDGQLGVVFSTLGLWSLYAVAPLSLRADHAAAAWALGGLATLVLGLRLGAPGWAGNALAVQIAAGILFISSLERSGAGSVLATLGPAWQGLVIASLIGLGALVSFGALVREARARADEEAVQRFAWAMIFGLVFLALAVLFVLPWQQATAVWAACGFVLLWVAGRLCLRPAFWFAVILEGVAGLAFLRADGPSLLLTAPDPELSPFRHAGFWTPVVLALSAFAVAWRLHHARRAADPAVPQTEATYISGPALLWAAAWWAFAWCRELRALPDGAPTWGHRVLIVMALTTLVALPILSRWRWIGLGRLCAAVLPWTILAAFLDHRVDSHLLVSLGWAAYGLAGLAALLLLRAARGILSEDDERGLHLLTLWVGLVVVSLESRYGFLVLGEPGSTWRWLGWVLPLVGWMLWNARSALPTRWPFSAWPELYRFEGTLPVVVVLVGWSASANVRSGGDAAPLPFLPLANPLDLALALVLFGAWNWSQQLRAQQEATGRWATVVPVLRFTLFCAAFLTYTCIVLRAVHHLDEVPWNPDDLRRSMVVQASLSITWSALALGLMIVGHRVARRAVWVTGAVLVVVVVAKLFFVELGQQGGLERIVSFIGVGVLLLVVGYFAPLPPAREERP